VAGDILILCNVKHLTDFDTIVVAQIKQVIRATPAYVPLVANHRSSSARVKVGGMLTQLVNGVANESKVGYTSLTSDISR